MFNKRVIHSTLPTKSLKVLSVSRLEEINQLSSVLKIDDLCFFLYMRLSNERYSDLNSFLRVKITKSY